MATNLDNNRQPTQALMRADAIKKDDKGRMYIRAQTKQIATDRMVILPNAFKKQIKFFKQNPVFLASHERASESGNPTILGKVEDIGFDEEGMYGWVNWVNPDELPESAQSHKDLVSSWRWLYENGFAKAVSVGWPRLGMKMVLQEGEMNKVLEDNNITLTVEERNMLWGIIAEARLSEISAVAVGADKGALTTARSEAPEKHRETIIKLIESAGEEGRSSQNLPIADPSGADGEEDSQADSEVQSVQAQRSNGFERGVIPFRDYGIVTDQSVAWDGPGEVRAADPAKLMKMCAWYDSEGKNKGDFKLPHHRASDIKAVWRGVAAAMGVVLGARGGLKGDAASKRREIYNHLSSHYRQFDKTPPEFRSDYSNAELRAMNAQGIIAWSHRCFSLENITAISVQDTAVDKQVRLVCDCGEVFIGSDKYLRDMKSASQRNAGDSQENSSGAPQSISSSYLQEILANLRQDKPAKRTEADAKSVAEGIIKNIKR